MPIEKENYPTAPEIVDGRVFWRVGNRLLPAIAGGSGKPGDKTPPEPTEDDELTPAQVQAINAAVTSQLKRGLANVVTKSDLESLSASLVEKVTGALAQQQKQPADADGKQPAKGGGADAAETKALRDRLEQLEKAHKAALEEGKQERDLRIKSEDARLLGEARAVQRKLAFDEGVTVNGKVLKAKADYADVLGDYLGKGLKVVDGKVVATIRKAPAKGLPEEDVDVTPAEAVTHFFNSKSASAYLPAPQPGVRTPDTRKQPPRRVEQQPTQPAHNEGDDLDGLVGKAAAHLERLGIDPTRLPSS